MEYILLAIGAVIVIFTYILYRQECDKSDMYLKSSNAWRDDYFKAKAETKLANLENALLSAQISSMSAMTANPEKKKKVAVKKKKTSNESIKRKK